MMPNSFVIKLTPHNHIAKPESSNSEHVKLITKEICKNHIQIENSSCGFTVFVGEKTSFPFEAASMPAGSLITHQAEDYKLSIQCDRLGTGILFWKKSDTSFIVSNRLENLVCESSRPDWCSIQQYLHTGYTTSDRTFYKDIYQTLPNSLLELNTKTLALKFKQREPLISDEPLSTGELLNAIREQISQRLSITAESTLMMSAGWDSRTLLINPSTITSCYSHGDLSSRELSLTRSLSGSMRKDHLFVDAQTCSFDNEFIDTMSESLGYCIFPIWFSAARNIQSWKGTPIMSGVLGELLGGHYGLMAWGTRLQKALSSFLLVSESMVSDEQVRRAVESYAEPPTSHWFVSNEGQAMLDEHRKETKNRLLDSIECQKRESGSWQRTLEDFNMAHRARQYILKQAQAASTTVGYTIPFADERLTDLVRKLDFQKRIHNKANRAILKNANPNLLHYPMAATLVAARHPIIIQEFSRFFRIISEQLRRSFGTHQQRLGWFNYEHLYAQCTLHEITDSLSSTIWDKGRMHQTLKSNPENNVDAGSTLDMLCKLKTVDHYLRHLNSHNRHSAAYDVA